MTGNVFQFLVSSAENRGNGFQFPKDLSKIMWCQQDITFCDVPLRIGVSSSKYYYSLIGVPKMDTWRGCDDISLDRPDPCGTEDRPQSQAPLSYSIAAPSDHN